MPRVELFAQPSFQPGGGQESGAPGFIRELVGQRDLNLRHGNTPLSSSALQQTRFPFCPGSSVHLLDGKDEDGRNGAKEETGPPFSVFQVVLANESAAPSITEREIRPGYGHLLARPPQMAHNPPMALKLSMRRHLDVTILDLDGRLSLGDGSSTFHDGVREVIWEGHKKLLLGNSGIQYFDSSGLGELVLAFTLVHNRGGELVLAALSKKLTGMMRLTRLDTVYPLFLEVDEALKYFDDKRSPRVQVWRRQYKDVLVLEIAGTLTAEQGSDAVEEAIRTANLDTQHHVICLCSQILDVSPESCEMIERLGAALREHSRELVLANVESRLDGALRRCAEAGIRRFPSLDQALAAFGVVVGSSDKWKLA